HRALSEHKTLSVSWSHYPHFHPEVLQIVNYRHWHVHSRLAAIGRTQASPDELCGMPTFRLHRQRFTATQ
ncbi:hypothetical protein, partial [Klebsiella michiganensis]